MLVIDGEPAEPSRGREGQRQARWKTIRNDDAVGPAAVAPLPSPCICTCCSGSCCRGLPTSCRFRLFFCATDGERYFCNDRLRPRRVRPFAGGAGERKRHVRYKSQSTAAVIYLPPPPPPPSLLFLPLPVVAVDGDDSRRRRHMAIIAPIQDRGGGQTNGQADA